MSAKDIINAIIGREGRFSNNPDDLGGPTIWGVTEKVAREYSYGGKMEEMPRDTAFNILYTKFMVRTGFDQVEMVSGIIAEELCDSAVNMGESIPGPWLQRCLNLLNNKATFYPDIAVDGKIGPATIASLKALIAKRGKDGVKVLWKMLNSLQGARYIDISEKREANETFTYGWFLNRVFEGYE